jgi:hypothetical protein
MLNTYELPLNITVKQENPTNDNTCGQCKALRTFYTTHHCLHLKKDLETNINNAIIKDVECPFNNNGENILREFKKELKSLLQKYDASIDPIIDSDGMGYVDVVLGVSFCNNKTIVLVENEEELTQWNL